MKVSAIMSKIFKEFLSGFGGLLDIIPHDEPPKLLPYESLPNNTNGFSKDYENIKNDWIKVGGHIREGMNMESKNVKTTY